MKEPVKLDDTDIGPEADIVRTFDPAEVPERGYLQWFFHSEESDLPIRDITNTQKEGYKTEPSIERKAENYCSDCYQGNIKGFSKQDRRYLFLYTNCSRDGLDREGERLIVGYIEKERILNIGGRTAVQGPTKLVSFEDAYPLSKVAPTNLRGAKKLSQEKTEKVLESLRNADNIYNECVDAVEELEKKVRRPRTWEQKAEEGVPPEEDSDLFDDGPTC
jgi:hypothetical protein